jgi:hypothetical protein
MSETVNGHELNIYASGLVIKTIDNPDDIFKALVDIHENFDGYREGCPLNLNLSKDIEIIDSGEFFADEEILHLGHYFIYEDATYEIPVEITSIKTEKFFDWKMMKDPKAKDPKAGEEDDVYIESTGTGPGIEEKTYAVIIKNGEKKVLDLEIEQHDEEVNEEQKEALRKFSQEVFNLI